MDNSESNQDLNINRRQFNEAIEEHEKGSKLKKILLGVAISLIILGVVLVVFYKSTREPSKSPPIANDLSLQKTNPNTFNQSNFENLTLDSSPKKEEDKFDQIVKDIQAKQAQKIPEAPVMLPASPLDKSSPPPAPLVPKMETSHEKVATKKTEQKEVRNSSHERRASHGHEKAKHEKERHEKHEKVAHKTIEKHPIKPPHKTEIKPVPKKAIEPPKETPKIAKTEVKTPPPSSPKKQETPIDHVKPEKVGKPETKPISTLPKGFYLQVGVFSKVPNLKFMEAFMKYPHQVQDLSNGQKRYLIGPYNTKEQADAKVEEIKSNVAKPVHMEVK
ncbi:SPOR domain-containing protein [Helicobacter cynogastricus]|uniref:SPOR domain-containing protein n=1 Tax=Helicobacter cynogastricus TaxID=329937 RepID=UPI000CF05FE4|nr:SPOR domain-containing protein [Helicobacter cynogastricus]